jgi:uncharacterized protein YecT (DUF1311 family)
MEPERRSDVRRSVRIPSWTTLALIGGLIIIVLLLAYVATTRNADQDKLTRNELAQGGAGQEQAQPAKASPEKLCASKETYDLIKRELFRRAAQLRGSDEAAFDQLAAYAVVRMENPVLESRDSSTGGVSCSGTLSLDLPPGVAVVGARRTLNADVDYTVQPAADKSGNVVLLRNADTIIGPLATLARVSQATPSPQPAEPPSAPAAPTPAPTQQPQAAPVQATPAPVQPQASRPSSVATGAHPSFDCARARTKGEIAVCSNAGLAALDRNMADQYRLAIDQATPEQKALLRRTRDRFISYRDRCPNRSCIGDAYVGRMREIRDIMEGSWRPHP